MINSVFFDELYKQFAWFDSVFTPVVKSCSSEFFFDGFEYKLASISTNMNVLSQNETFFVTKIKINSKNDVYIRISQEAINVILDKVLGKNNRRFDLTEVTELEANSDRYEVSDGEYKFFEDEKPTLKFFIISVARRVYDERVVYS